MLAAGPERLIGAAGREIRSSLERVFLDHIGMREAGPDDLEAVMVVVDACIAGMRRDGIDQWDEVYPSRAIIAGDLGAGTAFVATQVGEVVGFAALDEHQDPEYADVDWQFAGPVAVVHRLMVAPSGAGRGIGRALMRFAEARAESMGYACIRLDAYAENARALRLYDGDGYRRAGRVRFRKGIFHCFEKDLGATRSRPRIGVPA